MALSSLRNHVGAVVGAGAKKEMGWIDTFAIVAVMTNEHSRRDRTPIEQITHSVSKEHLPFPVRQANTKCPIAFLADMP
jgi:hypothetical protein